MSSISSFLLALATLCAVVWAHSAQSYANNRYVLLSSSKFYFNYRHSLNVLMVYHYLKRVGVTDDQIILMLPTDHGCDPRNPFPGRIFHAEDHLIDWLCNDVEVDYSAEDLTEEAILNLLRGRHDDWLPASKRLNSNADSRVFMFFNGHGGENFFKIQDTELIHSEDLAKTFKEMHQKRLYRELFFVLDTCQAESLFDQVFTEDAPNLILLHTARADESALADKTDGELNVFLADKFSAVFGDFLHEPQGYRANPNFSMADFSRFFTYDKILSHVGIRSTGSRPLTDILLREYLPTQAVEDVIYGRGVDSSTEDTKFFDWSDIL